MYIHHIHVLVFGTSSLMKAVPKKYPFMWVKFVNSHSSPHMRQSLEVLYVAPSYREKIGACGWFSMSISIQVLQTVDPDFLVDLHSRADIWQIHLSSSTAFEAVVWSLDHSRNIKTQLNFDLLVEFHKLRIATNCNSPQRLGCWVNLSGLGCTTESRWSPSVLLSCEGQPKWKRK